jgi:hypothetical protein
MGAVASSDQDDVPTGYLFWVASTVNARLGVLSPAIAEVADELSAQPGGSVRLDALFIASPYRSGGLSVGCSVSRLNPDTLTAPPAESSRVFVALRWSQVNQWSPRFPDSVAFSYPAAEGRQLGQEVIDARVWAASRTRIDSLVFDPCEHIYGRDRLRYEFCRFGETETP